MALTYDHISRDIRAMIFGLDGTSINGFFDYVSATGNMISAPMLLPLLAFELQAFRYDEQLYEFVEDLEKVEKSIGMRHFALSREDIDWVETDALPNWRDADLSERTRILNTLVSKLAFTKLHIENTASLLEFLTEEAKAFRDYCLTEKKETLALTQNTLLSKLAQLRMSVKCLTRRCPYIEKRISAQVQTVS
jgi:hypothetical protein